jgi:CheY-like chemotaxis protein
LPRRAGGAREAIAQALGLDGYEVDTARDGSEGATLVCRHPYDLIFCDLRMPEVDGRGRYKESQLLCSHVRRGPDGRAEDSEASGARKRLPWENDRHAH